MASLLIAGYGFLGHALKPLFEARGWQVDCLSRTGGPGVTACDLSDEDAVLALPGEYDLVIHCAASGGGGPDAYRSVYLDGCRHLSSRFSGTPFLFISSTSVYGQQDHSEVTEASTTVPSTETAAILLEAERAAIEAGGVVLRLSALCGAGRCYTATSFINGRARLDGAGERVLNFVHRDDVASACYLLAELGLRAQGQIYNISSVSLTQLECYQQLAESYGMALPPVAQPGEVTRRRGSSSKRVLSDKIRALGWKPHFADWLAIARDQGGS
ncbi:NAD-dependent epimerase/dehydratase family protein [Verrucomicrobiaceae bacterium N1E253]|uniref:NAD-dependent epimerase/dehydratase family protein n=1 Tax=Oceaniferula marina TaxID=2748318 RepID=A0A851GHJ3_9BACT|nr:NAD-dependent epimerase/dehydratase family protein [Oceaniferula marina]NWK57258.1 NAD-dependent epimerase/dehydratase family protein [Oceaniferula marina]